MSPTTMTSEYIPMMWKLITVKMSPSACPWPTTTYPARFITDTMTAKLVTAAITAVIVPGRLSTSESGGAGP